MKVPQRRDQITLPWLNEIFLPKGIKVLSFEWKGTANNGLGCLSSLERLSLRIIKPGEGPSFLSVIAKTLPEEPNIRKFAIGDGFCKRELKTYTEIFPEWTSFLDERDVSIEFRFRFPICYYGAEEGSSEDWTYILLLEDLFASQDNFQMWSQGFSQSLTWTEAKPILKQIALFHSIGLAWKKSQGIESYIEKWPFIKHNESGGKIEYYIKSGFDATIQMLNKEKSKANEDSNKNFPPVPNGLISILEVYKQNFSSLLDHLIPDENEMGTICHTDLHVNNMMFSKGFTRAVLFDFQAMSYSKPMKDLSLFLILNCDTSLISSDLPKVLEYYHNTVQEASSAMGVDLKDYTLQRITDEYKLNAYLSMLHIITGAPQWCFGQGTNEVTKNRFRNALIHMYNTGLLIIPKLSVECMK